MSNPWTKKNPFLSMWLSSVNRAASAARGAALAAARRQSAVVMTDATREVIRFWTGVAGARPRVTRRRKKSQ